MLNAVPYFAELASLSCKGQHMNMLTIMTKKYEMDMENISPFVQFSYCHIIAQFFL